MTYQILYTASARRDLKNLSREIAQRIIIAIKDLKSNPYEYIKKIKGVAAGSLSSYRVGQYRILLTIEKEKLIIFVIEIGHRKKVYRKI